MSTRARIRAGDPVAFGRLFDEHAGAVYRYAARMTADWATAEDVVSLTYLEAWRLRHRVDDRPETDSLCPWLLGIATNVLRNTARSARRHRAAMARLPARDPVPDLADEVVGRLTDTEELIAARVALDRLRRPEREIIGLCVWSGLDYASAAEALGVPVGTVRSRLSRARTKLRALARAELDDGTAPPPMAGLTKREPAVVPGQIPSDRVSAVRSGQERNR